MTAIKTYDSRDIVEKLTAELPKWRYSEGALRRIFKTESWKGTLMAVNAIGHLCEVAWHHPELTVTFSQVEVALSSHDANGITDRDFALASKIEEVMGWRPGADNGPLAGTPAEPLHAYLHYDE